MYVVGSRGCWIFEMYSWVALLLLIVVAVSKAHAELWTAAAMASLETEDGFPNADIWQAH